MHCICFSFTIFFGLLTPGMAETSLLKTIIDVNIAGRSIGAPLELSGDRQGSDFIVSASTEISALSAHAATALQDSINRKGDCEQRWRAWDTRVGVTGNALSVASTIRIEQWICKRVFNQEIKTKLGRETVRLEAHIVPVVEDGRPQLKLTHFRIHDLGSISRALGVEAYVRRELQKEIDRINASPKLAESSSMIGEFGYRYHLTEVRSGADKRSYIVVSIIGSNDALALARLISAIAELAK